MMKKLVIIALLSLTFTFVSFSQEVKLDIKDTTWYALTTHDGVEYIGQIIERNEREIYIKKQNGEGLYIPSYIIKSVEAISVERFKEGEYLASNLHASRYFYTPSAFPIKKGDGYIQTIFGGVWQFQYGITDNFSLGIGTPIIGAPIWITPKYSFKLSDKFHAAIGTQLGSVGWLAGGWETLFGVGYGLVTYGNEHQNISLGAGYLGVRAPVDRFYVTDSNTWQGYWKKEVDKYGSTAFSIAGMKMVSKNMTLLFEAWALPWIDDLDPIFFGGPGLRLLAFSC